MAQLPVEIIQDIITGYLPARYYSNPRNQYDFLLPFCHLHPSLTPFVQRLLFVYPVVRDTKSLVLLVEAMESGSAELNGWVESLEISIWGDLDAELVSTQLARLFLLCPEVTEVLVQNCDGINLAVFGCSKKLHTLTLVGINDPIFRPLAGHPTSLPSLLNLACTSVSDDVAPPDSIGFFDPRTLPSIRRLYIAASPEEVEFDSGNSGSVPDVDALACQIRHLYHDSDADISSSLISQSNRLLSYHGNSYITFPSSPPRPGRPLIAMRIWEAHHSDPGKILGLFKEALASGVIDS